MAESEQPISYSPEELLPHRAPMLLITECVSASESAVTVKTDLRKIGDLFTLPNGKIGGWLVLELMAQAVGVFSGLQLKSSGEKPKIGFLLGTRHLQTRIGEFNPTDVITVKARCTFPAGDGMPGQFECVADRGGEPFAQATLTLYRPESLDPWKN